MRLAPAALAAVLATVFAAAPAHAVGGYVCTVTWDPRPTVGVVNQGNFGRVRLDTNSSPGCTGGSPNVFYFCSTGATTSSCDLQYLYTEAQLTALYQSLVNALVHQLFLNVFAKPGCVTCGQTVWYTN